MSTVWQYCNTVNQINVLHHTFYINYEAKLAKLFLNTETP